MRLVSTDMPCISRNVLPVPLRPTSSSGSSVTSAANGCWTRVAPSLPWGRAASAEMARHLAEPAGWPEHMLGLDAGVITRGGGSGGEPAIKRAGQVTFPRKRAPLQANGSVLRRPASDRSTQYLRHARLPAPSCRLPAREGVRWQAQRNGQTRVVGLRSAAWFQKSCRGNVTNEVRQLLASRPRTLEGGLGPLWILARRSCRSRFPFHIASSRAGWLSAG